MSDPTTVFIVLVTDHHLALEDTAVGVLISHVPGRRVISVSCRPQNWRVISRRCGKDTCRRRAYYCVRYMDRFSGVPWTLSLRRARGSGRMESRSACVPSLGSALASTFPDPWCKPSCLCVQPAALWVVPCVWVVEPYLWEDFLWCSLLQRRSRDCYAQDVKKRFWFWEKVCVALCLDRQSNTWEVLDYIDSWALEQKPHSCASYARGVLSVFHGSLHTDRHNYSHTRG